MLREHACTKHLLSPRNRLSNEDLEGAPNSKAKVQGLSRMGWVFHSKLLGRGSSLQRDTGPFLGCAE